MFPSALPWPAPTSLAGAFLGTLIPLVVHAVVHFICGIPFFSPLSFSVLLLCIVACFFIISYVLLPLFINFLSPHISRGRDLDPEGYRENLGIAYGLGTVFVFGCLLSYNAFAELSTPRLVWPFGCYLSFLAFFHWSEFLFAALGSPARAETSLYMLNHSPEYLFALAASIVEYWLEAWLWPGKSTNYLWLNVIGLLVCFAGETLRKVAMWTAADNFSHYVEHSRRREHQLVRHGIYAWFRHPAYVGWFYWSLGSQVLLVNPLCMIAYPLASFAFFKGRVYSEERSLVAFFGQAYRAYQRDVGTGLPFIQGFVGDTDNVDRW